MPPAKLTIVKDMPEETKKPVAGRDWFKPRFKPIAAEMVNNAPKASVKVKSKKKPIAAGVAKKAPKVAVQAKSKKKPIAVRVAKKAPKSPRSR